MSKCVLCYSSDVKTACKLCFSEFCEKCKLECNMDTIYWGKKLSFNSICVMCNKNGCINCIETCYTCLNEDRVVITVCNKCRVLKSAKCENDHLWYICNRCERNGVICGFCINGKN
jgi:hypothetical protein